MSLWRSIAGGAELASLRDKSSGREWLWQRDPTYWGKSSPVLFPMIGMIKDASYDYAGVIYPMTKHGFARDRAFHVSEETPDSLTFTLEDDQKTHLLYPFRFCLHITYRLDKKTLVVQYRVVNRDQKPIYFSIGGHPAFNCGMDLEQWVLEWPGVNAVEARLLNPANGLLVKASRIVPLAGGAMPLSGELFAKDALIFSDLDCRQVVLRDVAGANKLMFKFEDFPVFAIWSAPGPFICLEPWTSLPDAEDAPPELQQRPGMICLEPSETFAAEYQISFG